MSLETFGDDTRSYVAEFIRFADAKAGAILTFSALVASSIGTLSAKSLANYSQTHWAWSAVALVAAIPFVTATAMTLIRCIEAIAPRTSEASGSLASFPDVAKLPPERYAELCRALTPDALSDEFAKVNVQLSVVASAKYASIRQASHWLLAQVLSGYVIGLTAAAVRGLGG